MEPTNLQENLSSTIPEQQTNLAKSNSSLQTATQQEKTQAVDNATNNDKNVTYVNTQTETTAPVLENVSNKETSSENTAIKTDENAENEKATTITATEIITTTNKTNTTTNNTSNDETDKVFTSLESMSISKANTNKIEESDAESLEFNNNSHVDKKNIIAKTQPPEQVLNLSENVILDDSSSTSTIVPDSNVSSTDEICTSNTSSSSKTDIESKLISLKFYRELLHCVALFIKLQYCLNT